MAKATASKKKSKETGKDASNVSKLKAAPVETSEGSGGSNRKTLELFHDADKVPYVTYETDGGYLSTCAVRSGDFKDYVLHSYWKMFGAVPKKSIITSDIDNYAAQAKFEGKQHDVFLRSGNHDGNIFIDLCNDQGQAVEITKNGWTVVTKPECKFRRAAGMRPLPVPVTGGSIEELTGAINLKEDDRVLFLSLLLSAYRYGKPSPITLVTGEFGSGKTTLSRIFRMLVDPSSIPVQTAPSNERDLHIACRNSWVVNLDNQSKLSDAMSDNLCRLATGGGLRTRTLYTDSDEHIFTAIRPVLFNSIEELATRADFLDRTVHLHTRHIPKENRVPEDVFWKDFESKVPRILGVMFDAVSMALRNLAKVRSDTFPRMADFAKWVMAGAEGLGFTAQEFLKAYEANRNAGSVMALDASPIYSPLCILLEGQPGGTFKGSTKDLLQLLGQETGVDDFPKSPRALTAQLDRITPNLRLEGIEVKKLGRDSVRRVQLLSITKTLSAAEVAAKEAAAVARKVEEARSSAERAANAAAVKLRSMAARAERKEQGTTDAISWLREVLKDGEMRTKDLFGLGGSLGHDRSSVIIASRNIGVNEELRKDGKFWSLRPAKAMEAVAAVQ